jgi:hypothetical protein
MRLAGLRLIVVTAALSATFAACGDDDSGTPRATATPAQTAPASTSPVSSGQPTPFPTAVVSGSTITAAGKGYAATMPEGWSFRANLIQTADGSVDLIIAPLEPGASAQASITVNCIFRRGGEPQARIEFWATNTARIGVNRDIVQSTRTVDGREATVLTYHFASQANESQRLDKQDIMLIGDNCDWILTMSAPAGQADRYRADFETFLNSFREIERAG